MRYLKFLFILLFSYPASATWQKINSVDYIWGPFKIYNLSLFSENGQYTPEMRPLMLTLKYHKPVDGRDFAISLARSWSSLGITLPEQEAVVDRLRKILPDIKKDDSLSYIALYDKGYFVLNDIVIPEEFNKDFNDAVLAVWLDPRVDIARKLLDPVHQQNAEAAKENSKALVAEEIMIPNEGDISQTPIIEGILEQHQVKVDNSEHTQATQQAVENQQNFAKESEDKVKPAPQQTQPEQQPQEQPPTQIQPEEKVKENADNTPTPVVTEEKEEPKNTEPQKPATKPQETEQKELEIEISPPADPVPDVKRPVS
ncbi:pyruvate formate lyase-activating protein [Glaesserella sp.]|uniref:pyruvate formate lyase-activating protein n=1 Tax=Glaesserella sp. TaxID=2094731 RepID=UPI00359F6348